MTNAEINLDIAIKAYEAGKLTSFEEQFVNSIRDYDKDDLKKLSKKQYAVLQSIYKRFHYQFQ